jgi:pectate lyase
MRHHHLLACALVLSIVAAPSLIAAEGQPCANSGIPGTPYEGFGSGATGGAGKPIYRVTTLADSGPGSLRAALQDPAGNRCIVFDVAGDIVLQRQIYVRGAFLTVDGFTAPSPGITLRDYGISIWGKYGARDVILRGLRIRDAGQKSCAAGRTCYDAIQIKNGASLVVIDRISSHHARDGVIDLGASAGEQFTRDVTIQWSIFSGAYNQSLLHRAIRVSMHHNLFIDGQNRNPQAHWDASLATRPPDTVVDVRNNLVIFGAYGTLVTHNATANVVNNYYSSSIQPTASRALRVNKQGRAYASGNVTADGSNVNALGTETGEFSAPPITTANACKAAYEVRARAGARGPAFSLDSVDSGYIGRLTASQLPGCMREEDALGSAPSRMGEDSDRVTSRK